MPKPPPLTLTSSGPAGRLASLRIQHELLRRLREDLEKRKDEQKAAKDRVALAQRDLERMVRDSNQGELFPGILKVDPETGEVLDYNPPEGAEEEEAAP